MTKENAAVEWVKKNPHATLEEAFLAGTEFKPKRIKLTEEEWQKKEFAFAEQLKPYVHKYGKEMIEKFYLYWGQRKTMKLLWETQKAFDLPKRLATFNKNNYGSRTNNKQIVTGTSVFDRAAASLFDKMQSSQDGGFNL